MVACVISRSSRHLAISALRITSSRAPARSALAVLDQLHVAFHVLGLPAERVRDERELRHEEADLG